MPNDKEQALREEARKIIRDYYNHVFEYAMECLQTGNVLDAIANAETKQRELDSPYLDKLETLLTNKVKEAESTIPDRIKGLNVSGTPTLINELDEISLQDLRIKLAELSKSSTGEKDE